MIDQITIKNSWFIIYSQCVESQTRTYKLYFNAFHQYHQSTVHMKYIGKVQIMVEIREKLKAFP